MWKNKLTAIAFSFIFLIFLSVGTQSETVSTPVIEYEPVYNDLKIIRAGDMVNTSWNSYQMFDNVTNTTSTFYRDYVIIRIYFYYLGNDQTYSLSEAHTGYDVTYGTWINYNTGSSAKWGGTVNTDLVSQTIKDNGYYVVFELVEKSKDVKLKVEGGSLWFNDYIHLDWKDLDNPLNKFKIYNRTLVYLTNNGSAFHDSVIYDPIVTVENLTINSKLNNVIADDTFTHLEIDDSDDVYLEMDGTGDYVDCGDIDSIEDVTGFTISAWIKRAISGITIWIAETLGAGDDGFDFKIQTDHLIFSVYNQSNDIFEESYINGITDNNWHHVVGTFNGTNLLVYVDGGVYDSEGTTFIGGSSGITDNNFVISKSDASPWNGSIDEVRIYNISLSARDISEIYNSTRVANSSIPNSSDLVGWWSMDEGVAQTAYDSSSEGNDGTLNGDTSWSTWGIGDNLVGYWNFDGDDTNVIEGNTTYDWSNMNNDGTLAGNATVNASDCMDNYGNCLQLDGVDDYINCGNDNSLNITGNLTISTWIKTKTVGATVPYITQKHATGSPFSGYSFGIHSDGTLKFWSDGIGSWQYSNTAVDDGDWHHVVVNYDGFYLDGSPDGTYTYVAPTDNTNEVLYIGIHSFTSNDFNGSIDEVMIFNTSLSAEQILAIYHNASARFKTTANHTLRPQNITEGNDRVNLTVNLANNMSSNISARIGQINITATNTTGLVLYMPMEWGNSTDNKVWDISGHENDGTAGGDATWNSTGGQNETGGFEFDGDGDYVDLGTPSSLKVNHTSVMAWIKPIKTFDSSMSTDWEIYRAGNVKWYLLRLDDVDGKARFGSSVIGSVYSTTTSWTANTWYHLVGVYNGSDCIIYVNGVEQNTSSCSGTINTAIDTEIWIGAHPSETPDNYFNGSIDDVLIFNRSLSATEISQMYNDTIEEYNQIYYTASANLTTGSNIFTIDEEADYIFPEFTYLPGNSTTTPFYSPFLKGNVTLETYDSAAAPSDTLAPDNVGFLAPTPANDTNLTQNNYFVNVSGNDSNFETCILELTNTSGTINYSMTQGANVSEWYMNTSHSNNMTHFTAYCNDTSNNWNNSATRSVNISVVAVGDTCDTCNIDCSENCIVDSELDCGGSPFTVTGSGIISIQADIKNWNKILTEEGEACGLICDGGCFF